jgi:nucleotide-binding universal stress UspA family protein
MVASRWCTSRSCRARAPQERQQLGLERLHKLAAEADADAAVARIQAPSVRRGLHDFAVEHTADVLVIGQPRGGELARAVLGDEAREVLDDPPCPVAVAPASFAANTTMKRIGVGYDESPASERALALAKRIAADRDAKVVAFQAVPAPVYAHDIWNVEDEIDHNVTEARHRMAATTGVEAHAEFADDTVDGLKRFGGSVDLLLLGAHTFDPPDHLLKRTKAQRLADDPPAPLLVLASARPAETRGQDKEATPCSES